MKRNPLGTRIHNTRSPACGLLWLTCSALAFATPLTIENQNFNIDAGGRFSAFLNVDPGQALQVFCVDYQNEVNPPQTYDVNISTPDGLADIADTRYGTTPTAAFSYQTAPDAQPIGSALNRYLMAAWLTTQYSYAAGANTGSQDLGIQNAAWNLLDTNGVPHTDGAYQAWENAAVTWEQSLSTTALDIFESDVRIYTTTDVALNSDLNNHDSSNRYLTGQQEMISVTSQVPEPATVGMLGLGLVALGLPRRRSARTS